MSLPFWLGGTSDSTAVDLNRRLIARIQDVQSELAKTRAELELVTQERDEAFLRLAELGEDL